MKYTIVWAGVLGAAAQLWAGPAASMLVEEKTAAYVTIPDFAKVREKGGKSPFAKMWEDEKVRKFIAPTLERIEFASWDEKQKARTGLSLQEWLNLFSGELVLSIELLSDGEPSPLLVAEVGDNAVKVEEVLLRLIKDEQEEKAGQIELSETDVGGVRIHSVTTKTPIPDSTEVDESAVYWFSHEGIFGFAADSEQINGLATSLVRGSAVNPLGRSERYQAEVRQIDGSGFSLVVDFNHLAPVLMEKAKASQAGKEVPAMLAADAILNTLGIGELDTFSIAARFAENSLDTFGGMNWRNNRGLVKLLAFKPGPVAQPEFVPQRWLAVNSMRFSIPELFGSIKEMFSAHDPAAAGLFAANLAGASAKLGFDVERDLIGSLGDDFLQATAPRPGIPIESLSAFDVDEFYAVSLSNPKAFTTALESALKQMDPQNRGMVSRRDYLGVSLATVPAGVDELQRPRTITVCVWRNQLFISIGSPAAAEAAIRTGTEKEPTLWQMPEVKAALEKMPANSSAFSFQDNRGSTAMLIETLARLSEAAPGDEGEEKKPWVDRSAQPSVDDLAKYWSNATGYMIKDNQSLKFFSTLPYLP